MGSHEPNAVISRDCIQTAKKFRKVDLFFQALAVGVYILPQKRDFFIAGFHQFPALGYNFIGMAALLPATDIRHDAIRAKVITAHHHCDPCTGLSVAAGGNSFQHLFLFVSTEKHPLGIRDSSVQHFRQPMDHVGAEHNIYKGKTFPKTFRHVFLFRHAAAHSDDHGRVTALDIFQRSHIAEDTVFRMFPHGAGVKKDKICLFGRRGKIKSHLTEQTFDLLPIGHVLLTAISAHVCQGHWPSRTDFHHFRYICHI